MRLFERTQELIEITLQTKEAWRQGLPSDDDRMCVETMDFHHTDLLMRVMDPLKYNEGNGWL